MTRKVLLVASIVGLASLFVAPIARADDPAQKSTRRTRTWTAPEQTTPPPASSGGSSGGLSDRLRAFRGGESTGSRVSPPSTTTGKAYRSVLRSPTKPATPPEPNSFRVPASTDDAPLRVSSRAAQHPPELRSQSSERTNNSSHIPSLDVQMIAPESVVLGQPASWQVVIQNRGDVASPSVQVTATLPANATVAATDTSQGMVSQQAAMDKKLVWRVDGVPAGGTATMTVTLVAQTAAAMALQLDWAVVPQSLAATVEVREPKLEVAVSGPTEMKYGTTAQFAVTLYNPGTGPAEDVTIAVGSGASRTQPQRVGTLAAGGQRTIELELAADRAGDLEVVAQAVAAGGLKAESRHRVRVRRPQLKIALDGPKLQFAGTPATYTLHIANRGDIDAEEASVEVALPSGAKILAASSEAREVNGRVVWELANIAPASEQVLQVKCLLSQSGVNQVQAAVSDEDGQTETAAVETQVELVADLKLTVNDPAGPQLVGEEVAYRITVENRGSKAARNVNIVAQFSEGVEPTEAKGQPAKLVTGQVVFNTIDSIAPGQKVELTVMAKASAAGSRQFRAEVQCEDIDTKLAAQESTKFFQ